MINLKPDSKIYIADNEEIVSTISDIGEDMNSSSYVMKPEISVLMSCYNGSLWLRDAIDSVLNQTYENFEFIIVDNGSTDDTWNIIQSYRNQDKRIVAISKKNSWLPDSLNVGIAQARGEWIAKLDADDICEPTRFEEQISFVRKHPEVVLLGSGFLEIDEQGRLIKKHLYPSKHCELVQHLEHLQNFFPHSSAFYRLDIIRLIGGYNLHFRIAQDWQLWSELALRGKVMCLPKHLVQIRKHSDQLSSENNGKSANHESMAVIVCRLLRKAGYKDLSVDASAEEWILFFNWIRKRMEKFGAFKKRRVWADARAKYFLTKNRFNSAIRFGIHLLQSGYAGALIWEKFFGSSLPQRLAREWIVETK